MSAPTPYTRFQDYNAYQLVHQLPGPALQGVDLNGDFDRLKVTTDAIINNLGLLQRSDGFLNNQLVTPDTINSALAIMIANWNIRGAWVTATVYALKDYVTNGGNGYVCIIANTGGTFATDLAAGKWALVATQGATGAQGPTGPVGSPGAGSQANVSGRLTLTTGTPVSGNVAAAGTVFFTPYNGNVIPIWNGTTMVPVTFSELSNILANTVTGNAGPAAAIASSNYDLFVWLNGITPTATRGGAWNSATVRSATTENDLQMLNGIRTNLNAITNGPAAGFGTYVGTVRTDAAGGTVTWNLGGTAAGGTAAVLNVWNNFNRLEVAGMIADSTASWTYTSSTVRAANASNTMRVSWVAGLAEDFLFADYKQVANAASGTAFVGIGIDVTNAYSGDQGQATVAANTQVFTVLGRTEQRLLGFHFANACESGDSANVFTWSGKPSTFQLSAVHYRGKF